MANSTVLFCCVLALVIAIVASQNYIPRPGGGGRPRPRPGPGHGGGGRPRRCPNGRLGFIQCNGFNPSSCPVGQWCYAPADAGVCCRRTSPGGGTCPPPSRRMCYRRSSYRRRCWSDRQCSFGQRCCFDGCQRTCQDTLLTIG